MDKALALGLYPFIVGDLLKIALAVATLPLGWKLLRQADPNRRHGRSPV